MIGLGRFGASVARNLAALGQDVIGIDVDEDRVRELVREDIYAVQADAMSKDALKEAGVHNAETVIIAIGENIEASILATMICKDLGIPQIITKADNSVHADVLRHIGIDRVVFPEEESGARLARSLVSGMLLDYIDMAPGVSIMELHVPEKFAGKSLAELQLRKKFGISILVIKRGDEVIVSPYGDNVLEAGDVLIVLGARESIERLEAR
mgnify:CR=1 FL=1